VCLMAFYAINLRVLILLMRYKVVTFILLPGFIYRYVQKMNYQIACVISVYIVLKLSTVSNYRAKNQNTH